MASEQEIERLVVRLMGDGTTYQKMLEEAAQGVDKLEKETKILAAAEKEAHAIMERGAAVTASVENATERYARETKELNELLEHGAISQETYTRKMKELGLALDSIQKRMKKLGAKVSGIGKGMVSAGTKMSMAITAPILGVAGAATKAATDINAEMANVASLGVPIERVTELKKTVQDMAISVGKDTSDLTDGLYQVVSAFGDSADSAKILEINAKAGAAGLATTTDAINLTSAVTKGYGDVSAAAVQKASDLAFVAVKLGQTSFPDLASSVGRVVPLTNELGVSQEELFAVMGTLTGVTGGAAEVSTQLRAGLQSLLAPTKDMTELLDKLGYASGKAMIAELGMHGALKKVVAAAEESGQPLQKFMGSIEGQVFALALTGAQADTYTEKLDAMTKAAGASEAAFDAQTKGINATGFTMKQVSAQAQVTMQQLGDSIAPLLMQFIGYTQTATQWLNTLVQKFVALDPTTQKWIMGTLAVIASIGPLVLVAGQLTMAIGSLITAYGALQASSVAMSTIGFGGFVLAAGAAVAVGWQLGKAIASVIPSIRQATEMTSALNEELRSQAHIDMSGATEESINHVIKTTEKAIKKAQEHKKELEGKQAWWNAWQKGADAIESNATHLDSLNSRLNQMKRHLAQMKGDEIKLQVAADDAEIEAAAALTAQASKKVDEFIASLTKQADTLGLTSREAKIYELRALGVTEAMDEWKTAIDAIDAAEAKSKNLEMTKSIEALTESVKKQRETVGMTLNETKLWELGQLGASESVLATTRALMAEADALAENKKLMEQGKSITDQYRTAEEKFAKKIKDLIQLREIGAIDTGTLNRAIDAAEKEFAKADLDKEIEFKVKGLEAVRADTEQFKKLQTDTLKFLADQSKAADAERIKRETDLAVKHERMMKNTRTVISGEITQEEVLAGVAEEYRPDESQPKTGDISREDVLADLLTEIRDAVKITAKKESIELKPLGLRES